MKWVCLSMFILFTMINVSNVHAEEIVISTGSGPLDGVIYPVKDAFEKETGIKIKILFGSAALAFKQFYKGISEVAAVGTSMDGILEILNKEGFEVKDPSSFRTTTIGKGKIRTLINMDNPVTKLSKEQLKGIFTGKITNWKEVGGNDIPIIVVLSNINPTTFGTFRKIVLDNEPYTRDVLELGNMDEARGAVEVNPEAISIATSSVIGKGVKQVETPEVIRQINLITKGEPAPKIRKFIDFILNGAGKGLVKE